MKKLPLLLLFVITVFSSCKKSAPESTGLSGTWQTVASAISSGGVTPWTEIPVKDRTTLTLNENGSVSGGGIYATYTIKDKTILLFKTADNKEYPNFYSLNNNELILNSAACIEGCSIKYLRIK